MLTVNKIEKILKNAVLNKFFVYLQMFSCLNIERHLQLS